MPESAAGSQAPELTPRQRDVLNAIRQLSRGNICSAGMPRIGEITGLASANTVMYHIRHLEELGYIRRGRGKPRPIEILRTPDGADA